MSATVALRPIISHSLKNVSDYFIALSDATGNLITNLKLQKLVYYAQCWHLALFKEPLFNEDFEAWVHGPVIPSLYNEYKDFKWNPVKRDDLNETFLEEFNPEFNKEHFLDLVVEEYFGMDAYALEKSTHNEYPWINARKGLSIDTPCNAIITKKSIQEYYSQFVINVSKEVE